MKGRVRRRGKNSWELTIDTGRDAQGKRQRKFVNVRGTKADADRQLRELLTHLEGGLSLHSSRSTVGEFLNSWLSVYAEPNTSARTVQGYRGVVSRYLTPHLGNLPLSKLTPQHVQRMYAEMRSQGLANRTTLGAHRILKQALGHAVKWGLVVRNVCDAVDAPRSRRRHMRTLDVGDVSTFLDMTSRSPYGPIFELAFWTGMRRGELMGLRWVDVKLDGRMLSVTQTLVRLTGRGLQVAEPKTPGSRRRISLGNSAVSLLKRIRVKEIEDRLSLGMRWDESGYVFCRNDGSPIDPDAVTHAFQRVIKTTLLPNIRFHDLRHTHATLMLAQGVHPKIVSERLGHSSISITLDTYSHVLPGLQDAVAQSFEDNLKKATA